MTDHQELSPRGLHGSGAVAFSTRGEYGVRFMVALARMDHGFRFGVSGKGFDQTRTPMAECGIEFVLRKR